MFVKKTKRLSKNRKVKYGLLFILPWLIGFLIFIFWPMLQSFYFSLNTIRMRPNERVYRFEGFGNYQDVWFKDMLFVQELIGFLISTILRVPVIVVFALIIAMLLNQKIKLKGFFRTVFFLPVIIASGPVMNQLISQGATSIPMMDLGTINNLLYQFLPEWLASPISGLFGEIIIILWYSGVQILIFLAGLQKIDRSLYEAAKIDGGSSWECFWKITLPILKPMILLNTIYTLITLSNSGQNNIINLIYNNMFAATRGYGFASAMAWMYALIILIMVGFVFLLFRDTNASSTIRKKSKWSIKLTKKGGLKRGRYPTRES